MVISRTRIVGAAEEPNHAMSFATASTPASMESMWPEMFTSVTGKAILPF